MLIRVAHSPDPDDAFMFYALKEKKFPTGRYEFKDILGDIQSLNREAFKGTYEVTAISIHAYPHLAERYALMNVGGSMGLNYGPIVVAREEMNSLKKKKVAIPGKLTSAYLAMKLYQEEFEEVEMRFDYIPQAVAQGEVDAGLLIHEAQMTYGEMGLKKVVDLGEWWYEKHSLPLPLGGNAIKRSLGKEPMQEVTSYLKRSIEYAMEHEEEALEYALSFGMDIDKEKNKKFVHMYVNSYTLDYGSSGREPVRLFLRKGYERGVIHRYVEPEFVGW